MSKDVPRESLGVVVSIDSAVPEGYEIVSSRKVEKDVYELVLARPKKKHVTTDKGGPASRPDAAVSAPDGVEAPPSTTSTPAPSVSSISTTWVVRSPQSVVTDESTVGGVVAASEAVESVPEPVVDTVTEPGPEVEVPAESAALNTNFFSDDGQGSEGTGSPTTVATETVPKATVDEPFIGATADHPITGGVDRIDRSAATSDSLSEVSEPPAPSAPESGHTEPPAASAVRVAPRELIPQPDSVSSTISASPSRVDERSESPDSDEDDGSASNRRRPFSRATKGKADEEIDSKSDGTESKATERKESGRRLPFSRSKAPAASKSGPTSAPIRPARPVRPRVDIDPRTGRPVDAGAVVDARSRSAVVDARLASTTPDSSSTTDEKVKSGGKESRPQSEFYDELVRLELVTPAQLDDAYQTHLRTGRHFFMCLHESGAISEDDLANEVATFYKLPVVDLSREEFDPSALDLVPERIARAHMVFPVSVMPDGLFVAVAEPSEKLAGLLAQASGLSSVMAVAPVSDVSHAIATNYHALTGVAELVQEFEAGDAGQRRQPTVAAADLADETAPIVQVVNRILSQAIRDGASDVHIEPADDYVRVRNRVDGVLKVVLVLPAAMGLGLVSRIKIMADMNIVERRRPQDGKFTSVIDGKDVDVRVATVATIWGENCVLRILDKSRSVLSINDLGMAADTHELYSKLIRSPFGMVLCVGPTGSGKTTTLYASLTEISDVARNVMTIEDPVEYVFPSINQIQTNEQAGLTFATGLKSILRQDSDIVLVGEIRDVETARIAVQSTLTGHFVLSSLHATDAISALTRFIDMGIESFLIASSVLALVGQRLVRRICSECKEPYTPSDEEMAFYINSGGPEKEVFYHGAGCNFCGHSGFRDRIGVYELCAMTPEMKRLIVGFATEDELRDLAKKQGMRSIQDEAVALIAADVTTSAEVVRSIYSI